MNSNWSQFASSKNNEKKTDNPNTYVMKSVMLYKPEKIETKKKKVTRKASPIKQGVT
jgi:hypothetical protein